MPTLPNLFNFIFSLTALYLYDILKVQEACIHYVLIRTVEGEVRFLPHAGRRRYTGLLSQFLSSDTF